MATPKIRKINVTLLKFEAGIDIMNGLEGFITWLSVYSARAG